MARKTAVSKYSNIRIFGEQITEYLNIHSSMFQCFKYIRIFVRTTFSIFAHPCAGRQMFALSIYGLRKSFILRKVGDWCGAMWSCGSCLTLCLRGPSIHNSETERSKTFIKDSNGSGFRVPCVSLYHF